MAKVSSSKFAVLLIDGFNLLASKIQGFSRGVEIILTRTDGLGDSWNEFSPTGMRQATVEQNGAFFSTAAASMHTTLSTGSQAQRLMTFAQAGNLIGAMFVGCQGVFQMAYTVLAKTSDLTHADATYQVTGQVDEGVIVQEHASRSADWNTKTDGNSVDYTLDPTQTVIPITSNSAATPTIVTTPVPHGLTSGDIILISGVASSNADVNGQRTATVISPTTFSVPVNATSHAGTGGQFVRANSSFGGVGYQSVSALTGLTGFVGKIRDSPDDTTYADLIAFTNVTGAQVAERLTVAGTVDRYLSYDGNVTGTGSISVFVGFKRNQS